MKYQVIVAGDVIFDAATEADAAEVVARIRAGNRWAGRANIAIEQKDGTPDPIPLRDKMFWWRTNISVGYAGWDCVPRSYGEKETVAQKSGESKAAIVLAASAMDAIAKSELLMYTVKGEAY